MIYGNDLVPWPRGTTICWAISTPNTARRATRPRKPSASPRCGCLYRPMHRSWTTLIAALEKTGVAAAHAGIEGDGPRPLVRRHTVPCAFQAQVGRCEELRRLGQPLRRRPRRDQTRRRVDGTREAHRGAARRYGVLRLRRLHDPGRQDLQTPSQPLEDPPEEHVRVPLRQTSLKPRYPGPDLHCRPGCTTIVLPPHGVSPR